MSIPVGTANVHIRPSFVNFSKTISKEIRKSLPSINREAGSLGKVMGQGFAAETDGIAKEAQELSARVARAKEAQTKASQAYTAASDKEAKLLGDVRVAEQRLTELRANASTKQSALIKAEETLAASRRKLLTATTQTAGALDRLTSANKELEVSQSELDVSLKKANTSLSEFHSKWGSTRSLGLTRAVDDLKMGMLRARSMAGNLGSSLRSALPSAAGGLRVVSTGLLGIAAAGAQASAVAVGIGAIGTSAVALIGPLTSLGTSLAPLAGLGLALPGLALGAGAALGVLTVALAGAGDRLAHLGPQMQALGASIQDAFWAQAVPAVEAVVSALMPLASSLLPQIATGLGGWATALSGVLTSASGVEAVRAVLANTATAVESARAGIASFASGLLTLGAAGSTYLPGLATAFSDLGARFEAWSTRITTDGSFQTYVAGGMSVLNALGTTLTSLVGIFGAVGTAAMAAGHLTIQGLAGSLAQVNAALRTEEWQAKMTLFFQTVNAGMAVMSTAFGGLFAQLGTMSGTINLLMTSATTSVAYLVTGLTAALATFPVQNNITTFLQSLPLLAQQAGLLLTPLLTILTAGLTLASQTALAVAPALGALLTPLSNAVTLLMPHLQSFLNVLSVQLLSAATILGPIFGMLVQNALIPMLGAFSALLPILTPVANILMAVLGPALQAVGVSIGLATGLVRALVTAFTGVANALLPIINTIMGVAVPIFTSFAQAVIPPLISAVQSIGVAFSGLLVQLQPVISFLGAVLAPAFQVAFTVIGALVSGFISHLAGAIVNIIGVLSGLISFVQAVFTGNWSAAWEAVKSIVTNALSAVWNIVNVILIGRVLGIMRGALMLMRSLFTGGFNAIRSIVSNVMSTVGSVISSGMNAAKSVVTTALTAIRNGFTTALNAVKSSVTNAMTAIRTGFTTAMNAAKTTVQEGIRRVVSFFTELPGKVVSALSSMGGRLRSVGGDMMRGLVDGIKGGAGAVIDAIGGAARAAIDKAKSLLGIHSPSRVFRDEVGLQITAGMGVGIGRGVKGALKAVSAASGRLLTTAQKSLSTPLKVRYGVSAEQDAQARWVAPSVASTVGALGQASARADSQWKQLSAVGESNRVHNEYLIQVPDLKATGEDVAAAIAFQNRVAKRR